MLRMMRYRQEFHTGLTESEHNCSLMEGAAIETIDRRMRGLAYLRADV
jgi:hypothetical protein